MVSRMITLTRLTGAQFALNPDLVERVDCTPDTVITLVDGTKYLVSESLDEVSRLVLDFRARIVAGASAFERQQPPAPARRGRLTAIPGALHDARQRESDEGSGSDPQDAEEGFGAADPTNQATSHRQLRDRTVVQLEPRTN